MEITSARIRARLLQTLLRSRDAGGPRRRSGFSSWRKRRLRAARQPLSKRTSFYKEEVEVEACGACRTLPPCISLSGRRRGLCFRHTSTTHRRRNRRLCRTQHESHRRRDDQRDAQTSKSVNKAAGLLQEVSDDHRTEISAKISNCVNQSHGGSNDLERQRLCGQCPKWAERCIHRRYCQTDQSK